MKKEYHFNMKSHIFTVETIFWNILNLIETICTLLFLFGFSVLLSLHTVAVAAATQPILDFNDFSANLNGNNYNFGAIWQHNTPRREHSCLVSCWKSHVWIEKWLRVVVVVIVVVFVVVYLRLCLFLFVNIFVFTFLNGNRKLM